jgi:hypothetical protein
MIMVTMMTESSRAMRDSKRRRPVRVFSSRTAA